MLGFIVARHGFTSVGSLAGGILTGRLVAQFGVCVCRLVVLWISCLIAGHDATLVVDMCLFTRVRFIPVGSCIASWFVPCFRSWW